MPSKSGSSKKRMNGGDATDYAAKVYGNAGEQTAGVGNVIKMNTVMKGGKRKQKQGGGILTDIAVPAVLLTANQMYRRNTFKKGTRFLRGKRSNRGTRRFRR